eukprot:3612828-Rhodomonas_salina.2
MTGRSRGRGGARAARARRRLRSSYQVRPVLLCPFQAQYPDTYTYRGQSYLRLREYELAVADLNSAIEIGSQDPKNWNLRALAHRCLARYSLFPTLCARYSLSLAHGWMTAH